MIKSQKNKKGFTLVELLIAVSLLAILSGVLFSVVNPQGIQAKARDSQRVSDLAKIKVALESYFADNRRYPISPAWSSSITGLATNYINKIPPDPKATGSVCTSTTWRGYAYKSSATGSNYVLATNMETASMAATCPSGVSSLCTGSAACRNFTGGILYYTTVD